MTHKIMVNIRRQRSWQLTRRYDNDSINGVENSGPVKYVSMITVNDTLSKVPSMKLHHRHSTSTSTSTSTASDTPSSTMTKIKRKFDDDLVKNETPSMQDTAHLWNDGDEPPTITNKCNANESSSTIIVNVNRIATNRRTSPLLEFPLTVCPNTRMSGVIPLTATSLVFLGNLDDSENITEPTTSIEKRNLSPSSKDNCFLYR